jgi:hypothetical protein
MLVEKSIEKRQFREQKQRSEDNIKLIRKIRCENINGIRL